jgi:hypothetical protein
VLRVELLEVTEITQRPGAGETVAKRPQWIIDVGLNLCLERSGHAGLRTGPVQERFYLAEIVIDLVVTPFLRKTSQLRGIACHGVQQHSAGRLVIA